MTPIGVRVGYASPKLLDGLSKAEAGRVRGRVVWVSTSNPYYGYAGVQPGEKFSQAKRTLSYGNLLKVGLNDWYVVQALGGTAVLKVRDGIVEEVGVANSALTQTRAADRHLMTSFS